jgi:DNA-damage-inducible protein D
MANIEDRKDFSFEDFKNQNGITYWWASDLMLMFGYSDMRSFEKVLDRTTKAMVSLHIPYYENIIAVKRTKDGNECQDFKLTRFACYLTAMNGDPKKREVAAAQIYFAEQTRKFEVLAQSHANLDRLLIRDELTDGNKSLASAAKVAKVTDYAKFQNAGYLGMYNMPSWKLAKRRDVEKGKLFDGMGRTELAANLFRVTQTEENIKSKGITGQANLEQTHYSIGRKVREIVSQNTGNTPENLPQEKKLPEIKKELKKDYKEMKKEDK